MVESTAQNTKPYSAAINTPSRNRVSQLDMLGTPLPARTPINLQMRLDDIKKDNQQAQGQLICAAVVSLFFIIAQLVGGWFAGSIAILTDSAHLASDLIGFAISIASLKIAQRASTNQLTFGWHRAEIIGSVVSLASIWIMTIFLLGEATKRFFIPPQVNAQLMLPISIMGLVFNLIQMKILGEHDHDHDDHDHAPATQSAAAKKIKDQSTKVSLLDGDNEAVETHAEPEKAERNVNVQSAYLHVLGDMLMSLGVIIAATCIYFNPNLWWMDPLCTYLFAVLVLSTSYPTLRNSVLVMMEGSPANINNQELEQDILELSREDIIDVHDLHVWQISQGKLSMSVHVKSKKPLKTLAAVTDLCRRKYELFHTTIQVEGVDEKDKNPHAFVCENDIH